MIGITAELQYVPLGDAHVLYDLPWCVWHALYLAVYELDREAGNEVLEVNMRTTTAEQIKQMVTKLSVFSHRTRTFLHTSRSLSGAIKQPFNHLLVRRATFTDSFVPLGLAHLDPHCTADGRLRHYDQSLLISV